MPGHRAYRFCVRRGRSRFAIGVNRRSMADGVFAFKNID